MKISELPQATELTGEELLPVVQSGETKKVTRDELVGGVPDNISIEDNTIALLSKGQKIGEGAKFPQITVDSELSAESENPIQNKAVTKAVFETKPSIVTFDLKKLGEEKTALIAMNDGTSLVWGFMFDTTGLNFSITDSDLCEMLSLQWSNIEISFDSFDKSVHNIEGFIGDRGSLWEKSSPNYIYAYQYLFSSEESAESAAKSLQGSLDNVKTVTMAIYHCNSITAEEV